MMNGKFLYRLIEVVLLGTLTACSLKEQDDSNRPGDEPVYSFKAEIVQDFIPESSRSTVNVSTGASAFQTGDKVAITKGSTVGIYTYDGSLFQFESGTAQGNLTSAAAFFPASMVTEKGEGKNLNLDVDFASQAYITTKVLNNLPMSGRFYADANTCRFYNLCTILKISASDGAATSGKTISSVVFTSHEASVSGSAVFKNGKMLMDADGGKTITLTGSPASLGSPTTWYLKLPSQTYPGGFELKLSFTDGSSYTYSTTSSITLQPGYISPMEAFTCNYFSGGSGDAANPYRIATKADLIDMDNRITERSPYNDYSEHPRGYWADMFRDKHYILIADIDMGGTSMGTIGVNSPDQHFTGTFDGQGHTISNVRLSRGVSDPRCGLFGTLDGATVKNLKLSGVSMTATRKGRHAALIASRAINHSVIEDCEVLSSSVLSDSTMVGAIAGELNASTIRNCKATGITITGAGGSGEHGVGGLVGCIDGSEASYILQSSFSGSVTVKPHSGVAHHSGGIVGICRSTATETRIENCTFSGSLACSDTEAGVAGAMGGIIGDLCGNAFVRNCVVAAGSTITGGKGSGSNNIGGIVGYVRTRKGSVSTGEISDCVFRGTVTGYANRTAGIVGINEVVPVNNCLVDEATINGATAVGGAVGYLAGQNIRSITVRSSAVTGSDAYVGGVVGHAYGTSTEIFDCSVENTSVSSTGDATEIYVGGVVGAAQSATESYPTRIVRCHASGSSVTAPGRKVGGIVGALLCPSLVDECWSNMNVYSTKNSTNNSGHIGGIVGCVQGDKVLVINCTYFGGNLVDSGNAHGAAAGIVGSFAYAYSAGDIHPSYIVNCFGNPASVSTGQYGTAGIAGYMCRYNIDNCSSPTPSSVMTASSNTGARGSVLGALRRGGRIENCYSAFQGNGWHYTGSGFEPQAGTDLYEGMTLVSDADMKAETATVTIHSSGETVSSLTEALNKGARYYNQGGDGVAYHGALLHGARAKSWAKGSLYDYPVLVGSPLCDANEEDYERTIILDNPNLTIFMPPRASFNGRVVIVVPGGGYHYLAAVTGREGEGWVPFYNNLGYACAVLRYTLPAGNPALPIADVENSIKYLRSNASSLHVTSVGIHGFSAGGHLASTIATHCTSETRPDFQILFYPVITMGSGTHANSKRNFLGASPTDAMVTLYSNQLQVTANTPPAFVMYYDSDATVTPSANGAAYVSALTEKGVSVTCKIFSGSTHGWNDSDLSGSKTAKQHLTDWLNNLYK